MATKKAAKTTKLAVVKTPSAPPSDIEIQQIDPSVILTDRNTRFNLKRSRIDSLKANIKDAGEVHEPVMLEILSITDAAANPGYEYRAIFGHYRIAAVAELRSEGVDILIPAIVKDEMDPVQRLKMQLSENVERENLSPIDKALAIKACFDAGMSRPEVRATFYTPGGRKGMQNQDASNSHINMTLSFLELPKKIQNLIHEGRIGVADAYKLTKLDNDEERLLAVEKGEAAVMKAEADAEAEENKFLEEEKKKAEADQKAKEAAKALEEAKTKYEASISELKAKSDEALKLYQEKMAANKAEEKAKADEAHKAAEKAAVEANKAKEAARKEVEKQQEKVDKQNKAAEERAKKLQEAKEAAAKSKKDKPTSEDSGKAKIKVPFAADKNSPNKASVKITLTVITRVVESLKLPGVYPKVSEIGKAFFNLLNGNMLEKELYNELARITGELSGDAKTFKKKAS